MLVWGRPPSAVRSGEARLGFADSSTNREDNDRKAHAALGRFT